VSLDSGSAVTRRTNRICCTLFVVGAAAGYAIAPGFVDLLAAVGSSQPDGP